MAKVIANSGVTVELSAREVTLIRQALRHSISANTNWYDPEDGAAREILRALPGDDDE
ncbi:hypothetical protein [Streptomyces sp. NPDC059753]|uniref:hypothetical protein n=1 Tax=Streptomyces sp. NPDC059753 TaxID=3346933 RepID=UPI003662B6BE